MTKLPQSQSVMNRDDATSAAARETSVPTAHTSDESERLPQPEDFSDPSVIEAVWAMHDALRATGWRKQQ